MSAVVELVCSRGSEESKRALWYLGEPAVVRKVYHVMIEQRWIRSRHCYLTCNLWIANLEMVWQSNTSTPNTTSGKRSENMGSLEEDKCTYRTRKGWWEKREAHRSISSDWSVINGQLSNSSTCSSSAQCPLTSDRIPASVILSQWDNTWHTHKNKNIHTV